jgi:hypothetical protein
MPYANANGLASPFAHVRQPFLKAAVEKWSNIIAGVCGVRLS